MKKTLKHGVLSVVKSLEKRTNIILAETIRRRLVSCSQAQALSDYIDSASPSMHNSLFSRAHYSLKVDLQVQGISHISLSHIPGNAGDILISYLQKLLWEQYLGQGFVWRDIYPMLQEKGKMSWKEVNKDLALIVGPGGLFSGAAHSNQSDWFLNITAEETKKLHLPTIVFGAGVNKWKHKRPFTESGIKNIAAFLEKCVWVGFRETAGIDFLRQILPIESKKLTYQPCPSLILRYLTNEITVLGSPYIAINIAADQLIELPVDNSFVAQKYGQLMEHLTKRGFVPILWCAGSIDRIFAEKYFPKHPKLVLSGLPGSHLPHIIRMFHLAVGTRMHSVFPFIGMGLPAIATFGFPIRASAMRDDLGLGDWLCDWSVADRDWSRIDVEMIAKVDNILDNYESAQKIAKKVSEKAWIQTRTNLQVASSKIGL